MPLLYRVLPVAGNRRARALMEYFLMSRSRKFFPISGKAGANSEKMDKRVWNRSFRKAVRGKIAGSIDFDAALLPYDMHKETQAWEGAKDGKRWFDASLY